LLRSNGLPRVEVTVFITVIYFRLMSRMSGLKAPIDTHCRITTLINNPSISCIASCVPYIVMLVAVATNIIGYTVILYNRLQNVS
jgi:hypothetical protein